MDPFVALIFILVICGVVSYLHIRLGFPPPPGAPRSGYKGDPPEDEGQ